MNLVYVIFLLLLSSSSFIGFFFKLFMFLTFANASLISASICPYFRIFTSVSTLRILKTASPGGVLTSKSEIFTFNDELDWVSFYDDRIHSNITYHFDETYYYYWSSKHSVVCSYESSFREWFVIFCHAALSPTGSSLSYFTVKWLILPILKGD